MPGFEVNGLVDVAIPAVPVEWLRTSDRCLILPLVEILSNFELV